MYRFILFDGRYDTNVAGTGVPPYQFSIHTGRDECHRSRTIALLVIVDRVPCRHRADADIARFFGSGSGVAARRWSVEPWRTTEPVAGREVLRSAVAGHQRGITWVVVRGRDPVADDRARQAPMRARRDIT